MEIDELSITRLRRNSRDTDFRKSYESLILGNIDNVNNNERLLLLKVAAVFLNFGDISLVKLGYRIIIRYSNLFRDYGPLYDVSINKGYIPVTRFIEYRHSDSLTLTNGFFNNLFSSYLETFKQDDIFLSFGQRKLNTFSRENSKNFVVVAPTSYGKSEMIISKVFENVEKKVCIIVPSKALLAQTKRRLLNNRSLASSVQRIITHPDMYRGNETKFVAVLTQERLLRLLQKHPLLSLDLILVDEAHNLLKEDNRATLLSQVLMISLKRNPSTVLNFFTPFLSDTANLKIAYSDYELESITSSESIKIERYFTIDLKTDKKLYLYDQFLNEFINIDDDTSQNDTDFLLRHKAQKNIAYVNRPRDIESIALLLSSQNREVASDILNELTSSISDFLHPDYNLLKCIKGGVVYHHGTMPDVIRLYVESSYAKIRELEFIVTSSTLLEGVNIPAEKIFLLTTKIGRKNFSKSQFKNLIGRVCRFSEVFNTESGDLRMLEPEIYIIKGAYEWNNANHRAFLEKNAKTDIRIEDDVENLLLKQFDGLNVLQKEKVTKSLEYLENVEPNTVSVDGIRYIESNIGKLCYKNNVSDFDIMLNESVLVNNYELFEKETSISEVSVLIDAIYKLFIVGINLTDQNIARLRNEPARKFYSMILQWRTSGSSYKQMITKFTSYWNDLTDPIVFVGSKWGEIARNEDALNELYIDLNTKNVSQRVNLAIVRIKEEQDFVDNNLMKYVEVLNDLELLSASFYERIKYGTSDQNLICLLRNGFSIELAQCVIKPVYSNFVLINLTLDEVKIMHEIISAMELNNENKILIFEIGYHIN